MGEACWPVLRDMASAIRELHYVPSREVAKLILSVESFLRAEISAADLRSLAKETSSAESELGGRILGMKMREDAKRTKDLREAKREEKRQRGQRQQERLLEKADRL